MMGGTTFALFLGVAMIAVFTLTWGGIALLMGSNDRKRGVLMLAAALVLLGNVLIWTL